MIFLPLFVAPVLHKFINSDPRAKKTHGSEHIRNTVPDHLIKKFSKLPGLGPKSAKRIILFPLGKVI